MMKRGAVRVEDTREERQQDSGTCGAIRANSEFISRTVNSIL